MSLFDILFQHFWEPGASPKFMMLPDQPASLPTRSTMLPGAGRLASAP